MVARRLRGHTQSSEGLQPMAAHRTLLVLRGAISAAVLAGLGATVASADAIPVVGSDVFQTTYFDVGTSSSASRAGYGGPGFTGGAGENVVRIVNPTSANGTLCAMVYVFDDFEEMQTCCGCPVTPDGLRTLSVLNDLTFSPAANNSNLTAGVIEVVSSTANWTPGTPPPAPNPMGTNGPGSGTIANGCSPTGIASNDPYHRATAVSPIPALRAWITHDELVEPGNIPGGRGV